MKTSGGGHAARGLDRVCTEALGLFGSHLEVIAWNRGLRLLLLIPAQPLVNAGILAILFLKIGVKIRILFKQNSAKSFNNIHLE